MSSSSRLATCARCLSTSPAGAAACARGQHRRVPERESRPPGSAYGYVDMGGWVGGQAEYVMVPYADWNLLKFPDKDQAMEKILDLTMLSDIFPTGFHGAYTAGVGRDRPSTSPAEGRSASPPTRRNCSACDRRRPDPRAPRAGAQLRLRAARRLERRPQGSDRADPGRARGRRRRRRVGFEARGHGSDSDHEAPATVLNSIVDVTRAAGKLGIPGLYVTGDPGGVDDAAKGRLAVDPHRPRLGEVAHFTTGQCPS